MSFVCVVGQAFLFRSNHPRSWGGEKCCSHLTCEDLPSDSKRQLLIACLHTNKKRLIRVLLHMAVISRHGTGAGKVGGFLLSI